MMEPVADNERDQPSAFSPVDPAAPPPAVRPPTEITPEQVRQFQEFQHFQELMRKAAEDGMPPGNPPPGLLQPWGQPPPKQSLPKRMLKAAASKIITGLIFLAILVLAGYFAVDYFLGEDHDVPPAHVTGGRGAKDNLIFEQSPLLAVKRVYEDIAQGDATSTCGRFNKEARAQFARNMSEYGSTCEDIVETINKQVTADRMKDKYANPWIPAAAVPVGKDPVSISSCAIEVTGGPRLGLFTVSTMPDTKGQWIVSGHQSEPADCGGITSTPSTEPSN